MKYRKRWLLWGLLLGLAVLLMSCGSLTDGTRYALVSENNLTEDGIYTYDLYENGNATLTGRRDTGLCLTIPDTVDGHPVTAIGAWAFADAPDVGYVVLGKHVTEIGSGAFSGCGALVRVEATGALKKIGDDAFAGCVMLTGVAGIDELEEIGESAFFQCTSLSVLNFPETLRIVGADAFYSCSSLARVILSPRISSVGPGAFAYCDSLAVVDLGGLTSVADGMFQRCVSLYRVVLGKKVVSIGDSAFLGCVTLSDISFSSSLTSVGYCALEETAWLDAQTEDFVMVGKGVLVRYNGKDANVSVPSKVRFIADAFTGNENIRSVTIGKRTETIGEDAFQGCVNLREAVLGSRVKEIGSGAFSGCTGLLSVALPDCLKTVGAGAFSGDKNLSKVLYGGSAKSYSQIIWGKNNESLTKCGGVTYNAKY